MESSECIKHRVRWPHLAAQQSQASQAALRGSRTFINFMQMILFYCQHAYIETLKHNPQQFYSKTWPAAKLESITRGAELEAFGSVQMVINASTPKT